MQSENREVKIEKPQTRRWPAFVFRFAVFIFHFSLVLCPLAQAADLDRSIASLRLVTADGEGNVEAAGAWNRVVAADPEELPKVLAAIKGAGPLGANWLRAAADAIAEAAHEKGALPAAELEKFTLDQSQDPRARRLAYEWLARADATASERIIPRLLHDPSVEFRRDAVARLMGQGEQLVASDRQAAGDALMEALNAARDEDQIRAIVEQLKKLERKVDLPRHFGFLVNWQVVGPFDNTGRTGFEKAYPPEENADAEEYPGKSGVVRWQDYSSADDYGMVDFNQPLGAQKETVAYAKTVFLSPEDRDAELRLGCKNAWKIWLNGELIFGRDEYHRGMSIDQYILPVKLKKGANDILVKCCQNEETQTWTVEWQFQLRVCDASGTAILSEDRP
jgi:hypothetical protein